MKERGDIRENAQGVGLNEEVKQRNKKKPGEQ